MIDGPEPSRDRGSCRNESGETTTRRGLDALDGPRNQLAAPSRNVVLRKNFARHILVDVIDHALPSCPKKQANGNELRIMKMIDICRLLLGLLEEAPRRLGHPPRARRLNLDRFNVDAIFDQILCVRANDDHFKACARQRSALFVKNAMIQGRMDGRQVNYFPGSHQRFRRFLENAEK